MARRRTGRERLLPLRFVNAFTYSARAARRSHSPCIRAWLQPCRKDAFPIRRCEKIAAPPPDVRKGSAFPSTRLNTKVLRLGRLQESHRLSAHQAAQPQQPVTAIFHTFTAEAVP